MREQDKTKVADDAFEKWFIDKFGNIDLKNTFHIANKKFALAGWQAASQHYEREIARLKEENHNLNWALGTEGYAQMATVEQQLEFKKGVEQIEARIADMKHRKDTITELSAQVNQLRDLLERAQNGLKWYQDSHQEDDSEADGELHAEIDIALATTAPQSLQAFENEIYERCARTCEFLDNYDQVVEKWECAEAIRTLKVEVK